MTRRPAFLFLVTSPRRASVIHQIFFGISLLSGCNGPKTGESDTDTKAKCSTNTPCSAGYKCNFGNANPSNPHAVGECEYQTCGLTEPCKKPQPCLPDKETASCDKFDNDKFCGCVSPNSQEVPSDPTTGPPTTGARP